MGDKEAPRAEEIVQTVRGEMLPPERNFLRRADALQTDRARAPYPAEELWRVRGTIRLIEIAGPQIVRLHHVEVAVE